MTRPISQICHEVFQRAVNDYHKENRIDAFMNVPYNNCELAHYLYKKCWIDTVQWHLEDLIRDPQIDPEKALQMKRRIDQSNQDRTDLVEYIDEYFKQTFHHVVPMPDATINTETPAWAIDRLSILYLKIFHMRQEVERQEASTEHKSLCQQKLEVLLEQRKDLQTAIDQLIDDIANGRKFMKTYKQMKMYNDPNLNPIIYNKNANNV